MKKNFKMFALSILSLVSISLCSGLSKQVKTNAEEVTPWEVRYDFEDAKGISSRDSFMWDNATEWMGNSYVTAREDFVINGNYSYHVWVNSPGAWKMAAGVKIPSNGTYTVKFRYKMINQSSFGTVKFAGAGWETSSNRGIAFGVNGANGDHNIATDYAMSTCIDPVLGIHELTTVVTTGDLDQCMFFSSMDNGAEYVIDDLVVKQGDYRDSITLNAMSGKNYTAANPVKTFDFNNDNGLEGLNVASFATASISNELIDGRSAEFNFTSTASDQVNFASFDVTLEPETYYQVSFLLRYSPLDRWFHVVPVDSEGRKVADAYFNLFTGVVDGFGFDRVSDGWNDSLVSKVVTYGFYTNKCTNYTIGLNVSVNDLNADNRFYLDNLTIVKGATYYAVNHAEELNVTTNKSVYKIGEVATVKFNDLQENKDYIVKVDGNEVTLDANNSTSFVVTKNHNIECEEVVDTKQEEINTVEAYMNLAYRYSTVEGVTTSEFRIQAGVDASIVDIAASYANATWGIEVSSNGTVVKFDTVTKQDGEIKYVVIGLGDVLNNISRATDEFTVKAYMVVDGETYYSTASKTFSVAQMIAEYKAQEKPVDGMYQALVDAGVYNV